MIVLHMCTLLACPLPSAFDRCLLSALKIRVAKLLLARLLRLIDSYCPRLRRELAKGLLLAEGRQGLSSIDMVVSTFSCQQGVQYQRFEQKDSFIGEELGVGE